MHPLVKIYTMIHSATTRPRFKACDRCYELKERCERLLDVDACKRCARLQERCSTTRPTRPAGRRRRSQAHRAITLPQDGASSWLTQTLDLSVDERDQLALLLSKPEALNTFVIAPKFQELERHSLGRLLPAAFPVLKDAYLALASLLHPMHSTSSDASVGLRWASSALATLRNLHVSTPEEADVCLTLATVLALFVYGAVGQGVSDICDSCLINCRLFIGKEALNLNTGNHLALLVLLDTMESVVHRRRPTLRIMVDDPRAIDRFLGLSLSLLPSYYDLCAISHSLAETDDEIIMRQMHWQLDGVLTTIKDWQPTPPACFLDDLSSSEAMSLLSQARVYRLGALLLAHRLRYPFGEKDCEADIWSREIMGDLALARQLTKTPTRLITLPFALAAVETRDPILRTKVLEDVDQYVDQFSPVVQNATKSFLIRVWLERDSRKIGSWLESIHKPCVVLNSIIS